MNLAKMTNHEVNEHLLILVEDERKGLKEILEVINIVSQRRSYLEMGYSSLFQYCVKYLKYSEAVSYQRISAAELMKQMPEVGDKLDEGSINITQLSQLKTAIKAQDKVHKVSLEAQKEILSKLENVSGTDTLKTLAQEFSSFEPKPRKEVRYKKDESVQIMLTLTKDQHAKLERVKALLSHKVPDCDLIKVIEVLCDQEIRRRTEVRKKQVTPLDKVKTQKSVTQSFAETKKTRVREEAPENPGSSLNQTESISPIKSSSAEIKKINGDIIKIPKARVAIPIHQRKEIFQKYHFECQFKHRDPLKSKDHQCRSKHFLEIEHIKPIAFGGDNSPANLTLLCRNHNQHRARQAGLA